MEGKTKKIIVYSAITVVLLGLGTGAFFYFKDDLIAGKNKPGKSGSSNGKNTAKRGETDTEAQDATTATGGRGDTKPKTLAEKQQEQKEAGKAGSGRG